LGKRPCQICPALFRHFLGHFRSLQVPSVLLGRNPVLSLNVADVARSGRGLRLGMLPKLLPVNDMHSKRRRPVSLSETGLHWVQGLDLNQRPSGYEGLHVCKRLILRRLSGIIPCFWCVRTCIFAVVLGLCQGSAKMYIFVCMCMTTNDMGKPTRLTS
jgi:hypothetical protein